LTSTKDDKSSNSKDELTQMLKRANDYMALGYVRVPSMVLCLSYRSGKGQHHHFIPDVHDLVFRMPTLEYRNKTWSTMDLFNQLKREVKKGVISHAGAIVGNLFHSHKISKIQQGKLRDLANSSVLLGKSKSNTESSVANSETTSSKDLSLMELNEEEYDEEIPRTSFASSQKYTDSMASSIYAESQSSGLNGMQAYSPPSDLRPRTANTLAPTGNGSVSPSGMSAVDKRRSRAVSVADSDKSRKSSVLGVGKRLSTMASKLRDSSGGGDVDDAA
jgi:hypothetical protein